MPTTPTMEKSVACNIPSSVKVFNIPELVRAIVNGGSLGRGDIVCLSQASRQTFEALIPLIWKRVCGVEVLLSLITSTSLVYDESTEDLKEVKLKKQSRCNQFKRFDIYAPFVKFLDVYGHDRPAFRVSGWPLLTLRAQSRALLPNLETLYLLCRVFPGRSADTPIWVRLFGNPNLCAVSACANQYSWCTHYPWSISPTCASMVLSGLADNSTGLQKLFIPPRDRSIAVARRAQSGSKSRKLWYEHLHQLPALRHVTLGDGWVTYSALVALGQLPQLEGLELYLEYFEGLDFPSNGSNTLPNGSFPKLRDLQLKNVYRLGVLDIMGLRKLLVGVVDFQIHQISHLAEHPDSLTAQILPFLSNAPKLQRLWITSHAEDTSRPHNINTRTITNAMTQFPLQVLYLEKMHLGTGPLKLDLGIVWSDVTDLTLPDQRASLQELSYFAAMPRLNLLRVRLDMTTMHVPKNIPTNPSHIKSFSSSPGAQLPQNFDVMMHNVRTLHLLFPYLWTVFWSDADKEEQLFKNLGANFNCMMAFHYHLIPRVLEESGWGKSNRGYIRGFKRQLERYRDPVNTGTVLLEHSSDCDCSDCVSDCYESDSDWD